MYAAVVFETSSSLRITDRDHVDTCVVHPEATGLVATELQYELQLRDSTDHKLSAQPVPNRVNTL
jgi:hypothetical protein